MKTVIFDFDGTIADSSIVFMRAWNEFADRYHYLKVEESDIHAARSMTIQQCAKKFNFPMYKLPIILPKIYRYFKANIQDVRPYEGIQNVLKALHEAGYTCIILSSNDAQNIEAFLQQEGITEVSQVLTSSKLFGKHKVLQKLMKASNLSPTNMFYIGDEVRDIEACNKCSIPFGWASWGLQGQQMIEPHKPAALFYEREQIITYLVGETNATT